MTHIEIGPIEPTFNNGQRAVQMRYDHYKSGGMNRRSLKAHAYDYKIGHATPEEAHANTLPGANYFAHLETIRLGNQRRRPIGAYVAGELVGISQVGFWTPEDQNPFNTRAERKQPHQTTDKILGLHALMTLQDEQYNEEEIARALLMDVMNYADGREIRTTQFIETTSSIPTLLVVNGFERTGRTGKPVGNALQELLIQPSGEDVLAEYIENE